MTYEYVCTACGHEWEAQQSINDAPLKKCPNCGKAKAKRQVSGGQGFILKGGGWYADGYASGGAKESKDSKDSKSTSTSGSSDSKKKSDTKSDSSSDSKKGGKKKEASA